MSISLETLWRYPGMDVLNDFFPRNSPKKESIFPSLNSIIKQNICCLALVAQTVKILPTLQETCVQSLFLEDSPGEENDNPLHNSCLENPLNRGAWWATVHGVARVGHHWATNANTHLSFYSEVTMIVYTRNCNAEIVRICCILSLLVGTSKKKKQSGDKQNGKLGPFSVISLNMFCLCLYFVSCFYQFIMTSVFIGHWDSFPFIVW